MKGEKYAPYKDYILFDNIFQIFRSQGTKIIRDIYQTDVKYLKDKDAEEKVAELLMMMISNNTEQ